MSFFGLIAEKKPEKNIEANFQQASLDVTVFKRECAVTKLNLNKEMMKAQKELTTCIKENNKRMGTMLLKKVKAYEKQIEKIDDQIQAADFMMIDLNGAKTAKKMNDLQNSAVKVYKGVNSQLKVDKIRDTSRNLEQQRELFKQKSEQIDEINNSTIEDMALADDDDGSGDSNPLEEEFNRLVEMEVAKGSIDNKSAMLSVSSSSHPPDDQEKKSELSSALDDILGAI
jgi:hypothetical protein